MVYFPSMNKPEYLQTKIFLDGGDPEETVLVKKNLGFLDGQTTNPSLVAKNPEIEQLKLKGQLTDETIWDEYKKIAYHLHEILPNGAISVEVYADAETNYDNMLANAHQLAKWFSGIYVKLPITNTGLRVAETLIREGIRVNMTLCFSQAQAAAVHQATLGAFQGQVFISPFIGRLDDIGSNGIDLIKNIMRMYQSWNSHVMVLGASIRTLDHLFTCLKLPVDIVTVPAKTITMWIDHGITNNPAAYSAPVTQSGLQPIVYQELLAQDWTLYDIYHELTEKGLARFASDWKNLFISG